MADLTPGPDLDRRVAEAVGWEPVKYKATYGPLGESQKFLETTATSYRQVSGSDAEAIAALEATGATGWRIDREPDGYWVCVDCDHKGGLAKTLPLAICAAILAWKEASRG